MSAEQHAAHAAATDLDAIEQRLADAYATVLLDGTGRGRRRAAVEDVVALLAEVERLRRDLAAARAALTVMSEMRGVCPSCRRTVGVGVTMEMTHVHAPDCVVRAALGRAEEDR